MSVESVTHVYKRNPFHGKMFVSVTQEKCVHRLQLAHKCSSMREEDKHVSDLNQGHGGDRADSVDVWYEDPPGATSIRSLAGGLRAGKACVDGVLVIPAMAALKQCE